MAVTAIYRIRENFNPHPPYNHIGEELDFEQLKYLEHHFEVNPVLQHKFPLKTDKDHFCVKVTRELNSKKIKYSFETSYFVGANWLIEDKLPILVKPKFDSLAGAVELDYLKILFEALRNTESIEHLDQLVFINFNQQPILIEQKLDMLTPLLVVQYIHLLKKIVRKGLKHSYYKVHRNLHSKIKGKVLVSETIKRNHTKNRMLNTYCSFEEFGLNHPENKLLKKALNIGLKHLFEVQRAQKDLGDIDEVIRFIQPAFHNITDDIDVRDIKAFKPNSLFKEYNDALLLGQKILKRFGYNISKTFNDKVETPPFWIDMSKLFELYVLEKLKKRFPGKSEVMYQPKVNGHIPDYLLKCDKYKMVVDAKYKKYSDQSITIDDIRQVSGYARMKGVYAKLGLGTESELKQNLDCLIIYPDQKDSANADFVETDFNIKPEKNYLGIYKVGIKLPTISK